MNINNVSNMQNQTAFEARIRMKKPNLKALAQVALGSTAVAAGAATIADLGVSAAACGPTDPDVTGASISNANYNLWKSLPEDVLEFHEAVLSEAGGRYDAAGYVPGFPVQSTIIPPAMGLSGLGSINSGSVAFDNAAKNGSNVSAPSELVSLGSTKSAVSTRDSSLASSAATKNFSKANPNFLPSAIAGALLSTGAVSVYEAASGDAVIGNLKSLDLDQEEMACVGGSLVSTGSSYSSLPLSNTKSGKASGAFVGETFSTETKKSDKNIPS